MNQSSIESSEVSIEKYKPEQAVEVARLIVDVYAKFNNDENFDERASAQYLAFYSPSNPPEVLAQRLEAPIAFVAKIGDEIVGMIRGLPGRIVNLYVSGKYHKKGIGKKMVERFEAQAKEEGVELIEIRASLYAERFYQNMGYQKVSDVVDFRGLKCVPMEKRLESKNV